MDTRFIFYAAREPWNRGISLSIGSRMNNGFYSAEPITLNLVEESAVAAPCMNIKYEEAQQLMDELWVCGLRPSEGTGSAGSLAATEKHLADMRKIAFKKLNID